MEVRGEGSVSIKNPEQRDEHGGMETKVGVKGRKWASTKNETLEREEEELEETGRVCVCVCVSEVFF